MNASGYFATSADGTELNATDVGRGPAILVVHGGMQSAARWDDVADRLASRWRIVALERRIYGRSGTPRSPHAMAREAEDILAALDAIGQPAVLLGHSSGGIAALEASLAKAPAGLMLYEPPVAMDGMHFGESLAEADSMLERGDADGALELFFGDMVGIPPEWISHMRHHPEHPGGWGEMKRLIPAQLEDVRAIRGLPHNLDRYGAITVPTLLVEGEFSPAHLRRRLQALHETIGGSSTALITGHGHSANLEAPDVMASLMDSFASKIFASALA